MTEPHLTPRQQKWFATIQETLERQTGKSLDEWVAIARTCPESGHRARLKWLKDEHGLLQNRASYVLGEAFGRSMAWTDPKALIDALWADPASRAIYERLDAVAMTAPQAVRSARKGYTAWSREFQFAAARPVRGGTVMLGLALAPETTPELEPPKNESWSERLKSRLPLASPGEVDARVEEWLKAAWERS